MISNTSEYADAGALLAYGPDVGYTFRQASTYVARILKGASPADLPFEQSTQPRLVVNFETARGLDVAIPQSVLLRANQLHLEVRCLLRRWRRLLLDLGQLCIEASPSRRRRRPDRHRGCGEIRIVEGPDANEYEMGPRLRLAEQRRPARGAEASMHPVAAVREARIIPRLSAHRERLGAETRVYRAAAGADILAVPAPTYARDYWRCRASPFNRTTQAAACYRHGVLAAMSLLLDGEEEQLNS